MFGIVEIGHPVQPDDHKLELVIWTLILQLKTFRRQVHLNHVHRLARLLLGRVLIGISALLMDCKLEHAIKQIAKVEFLRRQLRNLALM